MTWDDACGQVIRLEEYETVQVGGLAPAQVEALRRPPLSQYLSVQPGWQYGTHELTARQYVGTVALGDLRIIIQPKVPLENLFYMLTFAYDLPEFRRQESPLVIGDDLFEFVVSIFSQQVAELVRRGIYRAYVEHEEEQATLRGRLLLAQQVRQAATQVHQFWQRTDEFTPDLLENVILRYTLWELSRLDYREPELKRRLRRTQSAFAEVTLRPVNSFDCSRVIYTRLNIAYRTPMHLAALLLQHLSVEGREGGTPFATYLFDMNRVFELFVARFLKWAYEGHSLLEVEIQPSVWLDEAQKEVGRPDIVLRRDGRPHLVLDTKYKRFEGQPREADRNQMIVYCLTLGLPQGVLIYAGGGPQEYHGIYSGVRLGAHVLSLSGTLAKFAVRCRDFARRFAESAAHE